MTESARRSADTGRLVRPSRHSGRADGGGRPRRWIERDNGGDLRVSHVLVRGDAAEGPTSPSSS
ncbi:MAG: hypothetical protein ACLSVD_07820 [Eggerthellaceae bacterium]